MRAILHFAIVGLALTLGGAKSAQSAEVAPADVQFNGDNAVEASLTGGEGDAKAGAKSFADRKLGNCLACHANSEMSDQLFHGNVGPSLDGVAERYSVAQLRGIVANSKKVFGEQTVMPGFYTLDVGKNPREDLVGKTILTAEQAEDIVAYLATLK